jgi:hypothetical protein
MDVYPPSLREGGTNLGDHANRLRDEWDRFSAGVQGRGDIFGDDPIGGLIGASYQAAQQIAHDSYTSVADNLSGFGDGLHAMADDYENTDQGSSDDIGSV